MAEGVRQRVVLRGVKPTVLDAFLRHCYGCPGVTLVGAGRSRPVKEALQGGPWGGAPGHPALCVRRDRLVLCRQCVMPVGL